MVIALPWKPDTDLTAPPVVHDLFKMTLSSPFISPYKPYPPGTRRYCDVDTTSLTLVLRRNNVVCPVGTDSVITKIPTFECNFRLFIRIIFFFVVTVKTLIIVLGGKCYTSYLGVFIIIGRPPGDPLWIPRHKVWPLWPRPGFRV